jgi:hypothetical protein
MKSSICPIREAINNAYSGGFSTEEVSTVIVGGAIMYTIDDISYFINMRSITIGRALARNDLDAIDKIYNELYKLYNNKTHNDVFNYIYLQSSMSKHIVEQYMRIMALIANLEAWIQNKLDASLSLKLSLPAILLPEKAPKTISNNIVLYEIICKLIKYINELDLKSFGIDKIHLGAPPAPTFTYSDETKITFNKDKTAEIKRVHEIEKKISKSVIECELYQRDLINALNAAFEFFSEKINVS